MSRDPCTRNFLIAALMSALVLGGCGRKSETHDPDSAAPLDSPAGEPAADERNTAESPNSEGQLICTGTWFQWVNEQVQSIHSEVIAEQYPSGLPDVGTDEWFMAVDKLTGGDGAHGPDPGSDEWCFMMQQRLSKTDSGN